MEQAQVTALKRTNHLKLVWGLVCLIAPTALLILTIIIYAISNFVTSTTSTPVSSDDLFGSTGPGHTIVNVLLFLMGALVTVTWLPGIIVGIILLATRKPLPSSSNKTH